MNKKYIVELMPSERKRIQDMANAKTVSTTIRKRANILLLADERAGKPMKQEEISVRCGVSDVTVYHTLKDYCTCGLDYTLKFKRTKATNPPIVTGETEAHIIALACGEPPQGFSRWTVRLLTERIVELKILKRVSRETVRGTLKKHYLNLT
ncbi:MAG: helix-turn-helix domain-containing protein [Desulfovibrio sp.]|jgi:transposase|nr:helix-turn-helix domain-containing protein [Desulfovibrio sp.]